VAAIGGLSVAVASYFWANRLVPVATTNRSEAEIHIFFAVWVLCLLHAVVRPHAKAWLEQMVLAAVGFGLLPLLNVATGGAGLWQTLPHGQWSVAGFDLMMWALAAVHAGIAYQLFQRVRAAKPNTAGPDRSAAVPAHALPVSESKV